MDWSLLARSDLRYSVGDAGVSVLLVARSLHTQLPMDSVLLFYGVDLAVLSFAGW